MISVVICSLKPLLYEQVTASIAATIGVPFELVRIDNRQLPVGISEAYNTGVARAEYPFICFVHEDVLFHTKGWGKLLLDFFDREPSAGIVGVAGSRYKSHTPGIWSNGLYHTDCIHILQHDQDEQAVLHTVRPPDVVGDFCEVATLDGVFLFARREVCERYPFDQHTFTKFHCYDLDFTLQAGRTWKLFVTYGVLLEHLSRGTLNRDWVTESLRLAEKWPTSVHVLPLSQQEQQDIEWRNKRLFFYRMNILGFGWPAILRQFFRFGYWQNFSLRRNGLFLRELLNLKLRHTRPEL